MLLTILSAIAWQRKAPPAAPPPPPEADLTSLAYALCGLVPAIAVVLAVVTKSKTVAAFAQLGNIHSRADAAIAKKENKAMRDVKLHDQVVFTWGVLNTGVTTYLVGAVPQLFYLWHTPKALIMISLRWYTFRKEGKHFLLLDFCYFANGLALAYLWLYPSSPELFQTMFMISNGPLAWSVLTFSQALVFHSHAHMTSIFIHVSPMFLTFCLRWTDRTTHPFAICDAPLNESCMGVSSYTLLINAFTTFYLPWIVLYYLITFIALGDYLKTRNYQTLYDRVVNAGPAAKVMSSAFSLTGARHELAKKAIYMFSHLIFGVVTMSFATLHWHSFAAHAAFCVAICSASIWNASSYYFSHFAVKYESQVAEKVKSEAEKVRRASYRANVPPGHPPAIE